MHSLEKIKRYKKTSSWEKIRRLDFGEGRQSLERKKRVRNFVGRRSTTREVGV